MEPNVKRQRGERDTGTVLCVCVCACVVNNQSTLGSVSDDRMTSESHDTHILYYTVYMMTSSNRLAVTARHDVCRQHFGHIPPTVLEFTQGVHVWNLAYSV